MVNFFIYYLKLETSKMPKNRMISSKEVINLVSSNHFQLVLCCLRQFLDKLLHDVM